MRLFFALWPPPVLCSRFHDWAGTLRERSGGRTTRPESIHLTLAFLGAQSIDRYRLAVDAARDVDGVPFDLHLDRVGYFRHNRIVWAGPSVIPEPLAALARSLARRLDEAGFALERRAFAPHVTLLRNAREPIDAPLPRTTWHVAEFALIESVRDEYGSKYVVRERFALHEPLAPAR